MNFSMDALRWLTVKAIRGRTWAQMRVYDSPGEPADLRMATERAPFIAVYTDDADFDLSDPSASAGSLYDAGGTVFLVVEVAVAGQMESDAPAPPPPEGDQDPSDPDMDKPVVDRAILASTDPALEAHIGFMARQVIDALAAPDNPWAELWRRLAPERASVQVRRGGSGLDPKQDGAIRFASRVMRFELGVLGEPVPGDCLVPGGFWTDFLAMAGADEELDGVASILRDHLEGTGQEPWLVAQRGMTLTDQGVRGIGIGPAIQESRETPPLTGVDTAWSGPDE
jgi:hypothetical protein